MYRNLIIQTTNTIIVQIINSRSKIYYVYIKFNLDYVTEVENSLALMPILGREKASTSFPHSPAICGTQIDE